MLEEITVNYSSKVQEAIDTGKLWRAKEILGSQLSQSDYDPELYEQFGSVLLRMNDDLDAGLYLFLSGSDKKEYEESIELFIERHGKGNWEHLINAFPGKIKKLSIKILPQKVQTKLLELGMPENLDTMKKEVKRNPVSEWFFVIIGVLFFIAIAIFIVLGAFETFKYFTS